MWKCYLPVCSFYYVNLNDLCACYIHFFFLSLSRSWSFTISLWSLRSAIESCLTFMTFCMKLTLSETTFSPIVLSSTMFSVCGVDRLWASVDTLLKSYFQNAIRKSSAWEWISLMASIGDFISSNASSVLNYSMLLRWIRFLNWILVHLRCIMLGGTVLRSPGDIRWNSTRITWVSLIENRARKK